MISKKNMRKYHNNSNCNPCNKLINTHNISNAKTNTTQDIQACMLQELA